MSGDKINELIQRAQAMMKEHQELSSLVLKKKAELESLLAGHDKYKNNPSLLAQMDEVIKKRVEELKEIRSRVEALKHEYKKMNAEISHAFEQQKAEARTPAVPKTEPHHPVKIASSPAVAKALDRAMESKTSPVVKAVPAVPPAVKEAPVVKEEKKEAPKPPRPEMKKAPSGNLYSKAASEAAAQEQFLKNQNRSTKNYGDV